MKKIIILLFSTSLFLSCNTKSNNSLNVSSTTKINEGKNIIDSRINEVKKIYEGLCNGVRNDQVKMKFAELQVELRNINELGYEFELLSSDDQFALLKYANEQIEKEPSLNTLMNNATVDCW
jgi:hypothetical protein